MGTIEIIESQQELLKVAQALLEYIDAIPKEIQFDCMPGVDRDWVEQVIEAAKK